MSPLAEAGWPFCDLARALERARGGRRTAPAHNRLSSGRAGAAKTMTIPAIVIVAGLIQLGAGAQLSLEGTIQQLQNMAGAKRA